MDKSRKPDFPAFVAAYMRMSTDMQRYSLENQARAIHAYANAHGMSIVRVYEDAGKSGLTLEHRPGLSRLLRDIEQGHTGFDAVLVLDVSRWGRFQNTDEGAFYEFLCWKGGVRVLYVAELFENDQSPFSMVFKGLKRAMAAEYSRELSAKTTAGQRHLAGFGYRQGAIPGYGLRRLLVSADGEPKMELREGERKSLTTDRVILIPGPPEEVQTVRWMYEQYAAGSDCTAIARMLNAQGILNHRGKPWVYGTVKTILYGEKYGGHAVYCRASKKLAGPLTHNPESEWVRRDGAYQAVVPLGLFQAVRAKRARSKLHHSDEALLDSVRKVYQKHGRLTGDLLDAEPRLVCSHRLAIRFGGLNGLYQKVGYTPPNHRRYRLIRAWVSAWRESLTAYARDVLEEGGSKVYRDGWILDIDRCWTVSFLIVHAARPPGRAQAWYSHRRPPPTDIVVYARAVFGEPGPRDYFVLPALLFPTWPSGFYDHNGPLIESCQYPSLAVLEDLARLSRKEAQPCG
jgi:DNA invertase Pin-like site-specific DNA recombinase